MKRRYLIKGLIAIAGAFFATGWTAAPKEIDPIVILISLDGTRPADLETFKPPTLIQLAKEGVYATRLNPTFPSLTFPNHYTQVTGLYPQNHGIVNNTMDDPSIPGRFSLSNGPVMRDPRWWKGEPIWTTVEKFGILAGTMFWLGSDVEINGDRPTYYKSFDGTMPALNRVQQVLQWLDLPEAQRPRFLTLYFDEADSAGHKFGPGSPQVGKALQEIDAAIKALGAGLQDRKLLDRTNLIIVSDHGMTSTPSNRAIRIDQLSNVRPEEVINGGGLMGLLPKSKARLNELYNQLKNAHPAMKVYLKEEMPEEYHYRDSVRIPPLLLVAEDGYYITGRAAFNVGSHGYDPKLQSMKAIFIGYGPSLIKKKTVPEYETLDIYELIAMILNVQPAKNDGSFERAAKVVNGRAVCNVRVFRHAQLRKACRSKSTHLSMDVENDTGLDFDQSLDPQKEMLATF